MTAGFTRRDFLRAGALLVAFRLADEAWHPVPALRAAGLPGDTDPDPAQLDSWLAVGADGAVTLYSGKVELGTGVETALAQIAAEELGVAMSRVRVVMGTTGEVPDQGATVGSQTLQRGGPQVRRAAAAARAFLLDLAAARLGVPAARLTVRDGVVSAGGASVSYADLVGGRRFAHAIGGDVVPRPPSAYTVVGTAVPRLDIPAKITAAHTYVHDVRVPGMLHGRVVRPPAIGASLESVDESSVATLPGAPRVVRHGDFLGVVTEGEAQAIAAARALAARWRMPGAPLPAMDAMYDAMRGAPASERVLADVGDAAGALAGSAGVLRATYHMPWQSHASMGPSCGVADVRADSATVWSATQGAYALRAALAELLGIPEPRVRVEWTEGSGCYGHNGADDAAADAAVLSRAVGRPVRVQWSREDEMAWDPKGPAMLMEAAGTLGAGGAVRAWDYVVTTPTHSARPGGHAGNLLAGQLMGLAPRTGHVGGDRNARHSYDFASSRVRVRWLDHAVLRASAMRGLGAPANVFAIESFVDELAAAARADPVRFRLRHLRDPRAAAVVERAAAMAHWDERPSPRAGAAHGDAATGRGMAFLQYENAFAYVATVAEVEVERRTGRVRVTRVWVAHDCGLVVNPDGLRNQIEGGTVQSISRTLHEEVRFDRDRVTSVDWRSYPILTFPEVPRSVEIALLDRPELPALGAGEPAACTVPAAIANAVFDATGARVRDLPFTAERVRRALG